MTRIMISLLLAISAFAADTQPVKPPSIPAEIERDYERSRANELESARLHESDLAKLQADFAKAQEACTASGGGAVQNPDRNKPLVCPAKPKASEEKN